MATMARSKPNIDNMASVATMTVDMLQQTVYYHLDNCFYDNALFFAERLYAQEESSENVFLLSTCYLRLGDERSAHHFSKAVGYRGGHLGCSYIFAHSCLRLGLLKEGITALEKSKGLWSSKQNMGRHGAGSRVPQPDAAACYCLLGKLYQSYDDKKKAVDCFEESLKINPMMWDAFTSLCDMGVPVRVGNIFKCTEALSKNFDQAANNPAWARREGSSSSVDSLQVPKKASRSAPQPQGADPFEAPRSNANQDISSFSSLHSADMDGSDFISKIAAASLRQGNGSRPLQGSESTPTNLGASVGVPVARMGTAQEPPQAPLRRTRPAHAQADADAPRLGYKSLTTKRRQETEAAADSGPTAFKSSSITERKRTVSGQPVHSRPMNGEEQGQTQRRSARLNMFKQPMSKTNASASTIGASTGRDLKRTKASMPGSRLTKSNPTSNPSVGRVVSGNRRGTEDTNMDIDHPEAAPIKEPAQVQRVSQKSSEPVPSRTTDALKNILDLLRGLGHAYQQLSQFRCIEALQAYRLLPNNHRDTPWVLAQMARAEYEQSAYAEAEALFRRVRLKSPTRMQDMEVYSTILWHLKSETDLSFLAHELIDSAWLSPEAWCALGNAWSLAKDHEQALRCFKRATQLDPKFAYAYTLQGHEHMANEEFDKALTAFRLSISADRRHYNAYYGIGMVYEKLGNLDKALHHFQAATQIHPTNAVLICCMGTVLEKQKNVSGALQYFSKAVELAPRAAQARFRKARALLAIGQLKTAQKELLILRDLAPDDARVHFLLGRLYKAQNDKSQAVRHFTQALSLDPKASQQIKEAIESLEDEDGVEDSMMQ